MSGVGRRGFVFAALLVLPAAAQAEVLAANSFAWGENIGWLNAGSLGPNGPGLVRTQDGLAGYLWGENIGWVSFSCANDSSCGSVPYGVTRDAAGNLGGYAWGENVGWISLSCANTASCGASPYGVTLDAHGRLSGYAWGENVGWISLSCANTGSCGSVPFGIGIGFEVSVLEIPTLSRWGMAAIALALSMAALVRLRRIARS